MRDTTQQLTVAEQVGIWVATVGPVRYLVQTLAVFPLIPVMAFFVPHDHQIWVIGPLVLVVTPFAMGRIRRTDLTAQDKRRVLTAQLTGWSTGDPHLDGWAVHRCERAAGYRRRHSRGDRPAVAGMAAVITVPGVIAAMLTSPWWLLCLTVAPLYSALPLARALSDPATVIDLLTRTDPTG